MPWKPIKGRENLGPSEIQRRMIPVQLTAEEKAKAAPKKKAEHDPAATSAAEERLVYDVKPQEVELSRLDDPENFDVSTDVGPGDRGRPVPIPPTTIVPEVKPKAKRVAHKKKKPVPLAVDVGDDTGRGVKGKVRRKVRLKEAGSSADRVKKWREANREKERVADAARKKAKRGKE